MLFADYALLGLGGAVSCFAALRWERERVRRSLVLSFIGGAVCGLAWCLDAGIRLGSGACLLFLVSYMAVLLRHGRSRRNPWSISWQPCLSPAAALACCGWCRERSLGFLTSPLSFGRCWR